MYRRKEARVDSFAEVRGTWESGADMIIDALSNQKVYMN